MQFWYQPLSRGFAARFFSPLPFSLTLAVTDCSTMVARNMVHNFRGHLPDAGALHARQLVLDGFTVTKAAASLGVSRSTIYRCLRGPLPSERVRRGRAVPQAVAARRQRVAQLVAVRQVRTEAPAVRNPGQRGRLRASRVLVLQPYNSPRKIAAALRAEGVAVSRATVERDLTASGFRARRRPIGPTFFVGDAEKRVAFARGMLPRLRRPGCDVLFSDEKYCCSNDAGGAWQWVQAGQRAEVRGYEKWAAKVHVWGMIGVGVKVLVILPSTERVNAELYIRQCLTPHLQTIRGEGRVFMQDGAAAHTAKITTKFLEKKKVRWIENWPPRSPDLNPIERLWAVLGKKIEGSGARNQAEMAAVVRTAWGSIPQSTIDRIVLSFRPKLEECVRNGGELVRC